MTGLLLGVDVGATGIKTGFFTPTGELAALAGRRNGPVPQPDGEPGWLVWDHEAVWKAVCECIRECLDKLGGAGQVKAVACTGFGADGIPLDEGGTALYPMISWHCGRTAPQCRKMSELVGDARIYQITGYHNYPINTLNRLVWLKENAPGVLERTHRWLQIQDYIAYRFSGVFSTECTIASTTMMLDTARRTWSQEMLDAAGIDPRILPPTSEAGTQIGTVTAAAALETGLREGTPVVTGGHDCEIAVLGAGVHASDVFIDITGTWEILIGLVNQFIPQDSYRLAGLDYECHALAGQWICQSLMIAGGVVEWVRSHFYRGEDDQTVYETMFHEAETAPGGVYMLPSFVRGMGPDAGHKALGAMLGLTTATTRGQIVRAALEGLCFQLRKQVREVGQAVGQRASRLRVIGGAQKNPLWLQLKADATGLPIERALNPEGTLLGVSILAGVGAGVFKSVDEALSVVSFPAEPHEPNPERHEQLEERFERVYRRLPAGLAETNTAIDTEL